ncbi:MAG: response regulator [Patescibacteria group bacterium]
MKILVVEDKAEIRDLLYCFLTHLHGQKMVGEFKILSSGEEALAEIAMCSDLDIIFTDVNLPGIGGLELIRRVKTEHPDIRCVATSAFDYAEEAVSVGAESFFRKPYDPGALMGKILNIEGGR